jgi:PIN domain nuclease of toxin-antitoxin system
LRLLLDSQALVWSLTEPSRLRAETLQCLEQRTTAIWYSPISLWELGIKRAKGRLRFSNEVLLAGIEEQSIRELPVFTRHAVAAAELPRHHNDPFDRMLVAQARSEDLTLVSSDRLLRQYPVAFLEA